MMWLAPFGMAALVYTVLIHQSQADHLHFNDGTFSLAAPFWTVVARSAFRMMWLPGFLALGILAWTRDRGYVHLIALSLTWIIITLLPYSFLTYMPFVPSRHTYLASAGLAIIIAAALVSLAQRSPRSRHVAAGLAVVLVASQTAYVWTKKQAQFEERAAPTERLLEFLADVEEPVSIGGGCFPYSKDVAEWAVRIRLNREPRFIDDQDGSAKALSFCQEDQRN